MNEITQDLWTNIEIGTATLEIDSSWINPYYFTTTPKTFSTTDVTNVKIINDKVVIVYFKDGDKQKVVCQDGDVFSPEAGIALAVIKHLCGGDSGKFNKFLRDCVKMDSKAKADAQKSEEEKKKKAEAKARAKEKGKQRKARKLAEKTAREIEIQKAAYLAAMKEMKGIE